MQAEENPQKQGYSPSFIWGLNLLLTEVDNVTSMDQTECQLLCFRSHEKTAISV